MRDFIVAMVVNLTAEFVFGIENFGAIVLS